MHSEHTSETVLEDKVAPRNTPTFDPKLKARTLITRVKNNGVASTDTIFFITNKNTNDDSENCLHCQRITVTSAHQDSCNQLNECCDSIPWMTVLLKT